MKAVQLVGAAAVCLLVAQIARGASGAPLALQTIRDARVGEPEAIVAARDGSVWFTNAATGTVAHLTQKARLTTLVSSEQTQAGALALGPDGSLWFGNGYGSVMRRSPAGVLTDYAVAASVPAGGLAVAKDGTAWFTTGGETIGEIAPDGSVSYLNDPESMRGTQGIVAGPDGAIWFTNYLGSSIGRIGADGSVAAYTDPRVRYPAGIAVGPDGALWFTDDSGAVGRIATTGAIEVFGSAATVGHPDAITVGPDRALWVTGRGGYVARVTTAGTVTTYAVPQAGFATAIASAGGYLWLTNYTGSSIVRLAPVASVRKTKKTTAKKKPAAKKTPLVRVARTTQSKLPRVTLITDSVAGAVWFDPGARSIAARGIDLFLEPGQGRMLGSTDPNAQPETALRLIPQLGRRIGPTAVMFIGDNDYYANDAENVAAADAELRAAGVTRIVWVTLHVSPDHTSYTFMNDAIAAAAAADPAHVSVADWNAYSAGHPDWFQVDGVHLTGAGPRALAGFLHGTLVGLGIARG
jgi:streptogramin lyase